jgi:hypothetical protein
MQSTPLDVKALQDYLQPSIAAGIWAKKSNSCHRKSN